jgi:hypothetical protein
MKVVTVPSLERGVGSRLDRDVIKGGLRNACFGARAARDQ